MSRNADVAKLLFEIAEILELQQVAFKPRAYERAAQNIEALGEDVATLIQEGRLDQVPGVGKAISEKVAEFVKTGKIRYLDDLRKEVPSGVLAIMQLPGMGPKKASKLHAELKLTSVEDLAKAARAGRIRALKGFGVKSEQEIIKAIDRQASLPTKLARPLALETARQVISDLRQAAPTQHLEYAGSLRRGKDYVGDVDLLAAASASAAKKLMAALTGHAQVKDVLAHGDTKSSVRLANGVQVDLRVVKPDEYGAALLYFTGSKEHNVALRQRAQKKGWTLNEYALSKVEGGAVVASKTEAEIHGKLGLEYIPPELREARGEIEAAGEGKLPKLLALKDLKADLHTHTVESDGFGKPEEMLAKAVELGYHVYGISDHSAGLGIARGLDGARFAAQAKVIDRLRKDFPRLTILQGSEVNIKKSGELDLTARVRAGLDYVVGSVHSSFTLPPDEQTKRVLRAVEGGIDILGHPTGRLLGERASIEFDFEKVAQACADRGVLMEINASPPRLDLWGDLVRVAKDAGCRFAIDSDAHTVEGLDVMEHGVTQARRGWLTAKDVATAQTEKQLSKHLGHARRG